MQPHNTVNIVASVSVKPHQEKQREGMTSINIKILILDGLSSSSLKCKIMAHFQAATSCKSNPENPVGTVTVDEHHYCFQFATFILIGKYIIKL